MYFFYFFYFGRLGGLLQLGRSVSYEVIVKKEGFFIFFKIQL